RYVDGSTHAPLFDDVSEEEFLDSDGVHAQVSMSIEALQAQVAARNARLNAAMAVAATGQPDAAAAAARGHHARMLGEILVGRSVLTAEQLVAALDGQAATGQRLGEFLVTKRVLTERDLAAVLAEQFGLDVVDLRHHFPDPAAVGSLPESHARAWGALVLRRTQFGFDVVVSDPSDPSIADRLRETLLQPAKLFVGGTGEIQRAIDVAYRTTANVDEHVRVFQAREEQRRAGQGDTGTAQVDEKAPIVQVVNLLLSQAVSERASDVHIEPMPDRVRIRNRIDGALHEVLNLPPGMGPALISRIKVMANMNIVERRRPQDGQIEADVEGVPLDVRVSTTSTVNGEKCVLRILDKRRALFGLRDLGMPADTLTIYEGMTRSPYGMVICAGPTGSGKTTTLYATLTQINREEINVMTVEDPVEYVFPTVNQIQINEQAGITFAGGLRSILRQDPDAILVGEIRDVETARIAVQSALTGHLVLSSLHATDSVAALHRFLDMGIESFLISSSVLGVVGQRLVRRLCPECKIPYEPTPDELAMWDKAGMEPKRDFFHGEGCVFCAETGYQGRIGVYELLRVSDAMKQLVVNQPTYQELRDLAVAEGMVPLQTQALSLVEDDVTTLAEVLRTLYVV
ncbi:MAG: GspE/PulE family protein, partial [Acidimicrobiia bacterium]